MTLLGGLTWLSSHDLVNLASVVLGLLVNTSYGASVEPRTNGTQISEETLSRNGIDHKTLLTLSITFPAAFLFGILWCCCLAKTCGGEPKTKLTVINTRPSSSGVSTPLSRRGMNHLS